MLSIYKENTSQHIDVGRPGIKFGDQILFTGSDLISL